MIYHFPYIFINHEQEYPSISKHRGKQKFKGKYFGPFATVGSLNYTLKILQKVFQLRSCEDSYFENRSRPCLMHQIIAVLIASNNKSFVSIEPLKA